MHADPDAALGEIVRRFRQVEARSDAVVILGSDYTDVGSPTELGYNARIAANLGAPVLLVLGGRIGQGLGERLGQAEPRSPEEMRQLAELALAELRQEHAGVVGVVVNRADADHLDAIVAAVSSAVRAAGAAVASGPDLPPVWAIPEDAFLVAPSSDRSWRPSAAP